MEVKVRMNVFVTTLHIILILSYTILSFIYNNFGFLNTIRDIDRMVTAINFFSGLIDIFVAYMMWFIVDETAGPTFIRDDTTKISYPVLDILKSNNLIEEETDIN